MASAGRSAVAVIVVNYGTADLAVEAVQSVLDTGADGRPVEVHLVDNASPGADTEVLRAAAAERDWQGQVTLYPESVNHGFGRGNNLVIDALATRDRPPDMVFLLNPDARLYPGALATLARVLEDNPTVAAAGARIERPGSGVVTSAFRFPGLVSEFAHSLSFGPVARLLRGWEVALSPGVPTGPVDWVCGAAVMLRMEALQAVGGFDPDFFLYQEEVELMARFHRAGWEVWHVGEARAVHLEGAATGVRSADTRRTARPDYWYDSFALYHLKVRGRVVALGVASARCLGWTLNVPWATVRGKRPAAPLGWARAMWRRVFRPLLGLPALRAGL
ncbi:MAG: glycosyltransferase family 2 protein [Alkalilacustris sp.]